MILLLGGTSETAPTAEAIARAGYNVLVSTATEIPIHVGCHTRIARRWGRLSEPALAALIREKGIQAIVDATHPFATGIRAAAPRVAAVLGIEYLTFVRPPVEMPGSVLSASTHEEAATIACSMKRPVLLTIGSKSLEPYVRKARSSNTVLVARVLPHPDSLDSCRRAGIPLERVVSARGPFSVADNRRIIRQFGIGVIVTKESGSAGGLNEKLGAARLELCRVAVVRRPPQSAACAFSDIHSLVGELSRRIAARAEKAHPST